MGATVLPYNSWMMQQAVRANLVLAPTWEWIFEHGKLAANEEALQAGMKAWVKAVRPVLERLAVLHKALDLEDVRKAWNMQGACNGLCHSSGPQQLANAPVESGSRKVQRE